MKDELSQSGFRIRFDWGIEGCCAAAARGDIVVVVDVLRFSTTVAVLASLGALVYPASDWEDADLIAERENLPSARESTFSLSPGSANLAKPGQQIILPSQNGAACCRAAVGAPRLVVGALVNAQAVAAHVSCLLQDSDRAATIIACGERKSWESQQFRFAIEDYLGAGAILNSIRREALGSPGKMSPEAEVCAAAYRDCAQNLNRLLIQSVSGRELCGGGLEEDVALSATVDLVDCVSVLVDQRFFRYQ